MYPTTFAITIPPTAPAIPPIPTTEPTARRGNISETVVKRFADHPWCAEAASPTISTAPQREATWEANTMGITASAQINMAVLRPLCTVHPLLISAEEIHPPAALAAAV